MLQGDLNRVLCLDCNACRIEINGKKDESFFMFRENWKEKMGEPLFSLAFSHRLVVVENNTIWVPERV